MMTRSRAIIYAVLIVMLAVMPSVTVYAQDEAPPTDCGFLGLQCGWLAEIISGIFDLLRGFFEFIGAAINFAFELIRSIADFILTAIGSVIQVIINLLQPILDFLAGILRAVAELVHIGVLIIQIVVGFFVILGSWLWQGFSTIGALVAAYISAPVTAIPGLPQCVSAPVDHQLCALYYIGDWTLFAPNTPGALIVPLIVIVVDIAILFFFARKLINIINSGEKATDV